MFLQRTSWKLRARMKTQQEHRHTQWGYSAESTERGTDTPPQASQIGANRMTAGLGASAHKASEGSSCVPLCLQGIGHFQVLVMTQWFLKGVWVQHVPGPLTSCKHPSHHPPLLMSNHSITCDKGSSKAALPSLDHTVTMVTPTCCSDPTPHLTSTGMHPRSTFKPMPPSHVLLQSLSFPFLADM